MKKNNPTPSELAVLHILWANGPSSVKTVHEQLKEEKEVGYTTTLKIMQIMVEKGFVTREMEGKHHLYKATIGEDAIQEALLDKFLNATFKGSASKLVMKALGSNKASKKEIEEIKQYINKLENNQDGGR